MAGKTRARGVVPRPVLRVVVRAAVRPTLGPDVPVHRQRRLLDALGRVAVLPRDTHSNSVTLGTRPARRFASTGTDTTRAVLVLHGGGYTVGSCATHGAFAAHLAASSAAPVYLLDYRLAPEHRYPAALEDALAAYDALLADGISPQRLAVVGDSAGGGLALALALRARATGRPQPASLVLVSPWTDLTLGNVHDLRRDPMLRTAWLRACATRYTDDVEDPEVSPMFGDLSGLPPLFVHAASDEILRPDVERLVARARAAGVLVRYRCLDRMWHVAHLHAGLMRAATAAVAEIGDYLLEITEPVNA